MNKIEEPKYRITAEDHAKVTEIFTYHPPVGDQVERYEDIRVEALVLALFLFERCPRSRELSLALTHLQEAVMWANAAIAMNEKAEK